MDKIPYDFIDKVFTQLEPDEIIKLRLKAPLWSEVGCVYRRKIQLHHFQICPIPGTESFQFKTSWLIPETLGGGREDRTFADVLQEDSRFLRVVMFNVTDNGFLSWFGVAPIENPLAINLPEVLEFVSRFRLSSVALSTSIRGNLMQELLKHEFNSLRLITAVSGDNAEFIKHLLKNDLLQDVYSDGGSWLSDVKQDLLSFVCRPQFKHLKTPDYSFAIEDLKQIVAYWNSMDTPWDNSAVCMEYNDSMKEDFADWMGPEKTRQDDVLEFQMLRSCGGFRVVILCHEKMYNVCFTR